MARKRKSKENKTGPDEPKSKKPSVKDITKCPISSNAKGFLVSFKEQILSNYCEILKNALELLNEYADKVYRTDTKSCYFEHKLSNTPGQSPIFIETDMDNPVVLIDAIFADLRTPNFDVGKVKLLNSIVPVNQTCAAQPDDIIHNIKTLLEPVFVKRKDKRIPRINMNYRRFRVPDADKDAVMSEIKAYLGSKRAEVRSTAEGTVEHYFDVLVDLRVFRKVCCICVMEGAKSNRYLIVHALIKRSKAMEEANKSLQVDNKQA